MVIDLVLLQSSQYVSNKVLALNISSSLYVDDDDIINI